MKRLVHVCLGSTLVMDAIEGSRSPDYMLVVQKPASAFSFRFRLELEGRDESTRTRFDWWLQRLTALAEAAVREGKPGPVVAVVERLDDGNGTYYQNAWEGLLGKDATDSPRLVGDGHIFEFHLKAGSFTRAHMSKESVPGYDGWADGDLGQ